MKEIILVRHGQIDHNTDGRYCGWTNPDLNSMGKIQAKQLRDKLRNEKIDIIYTSDLMRCVETTKVINQIHNADIIKDERLREINFGQWEDKTYEYIGKKYPQLVKDWMIEGLGFTMPEGENIFQLIDRGMSVIEDIKSTNAEKILIVTHSGIIRGILAIVIAENIGAYWKYKISNCGITRIELEDDYSILVSMNE